MVKYIHNFLNNEEIKYFIDIFHSENVDYLEDNVYKFYYVNLMFKNLKVKKFSKFIFKRFRVQMINETINQIETPHTHLNPWSFIIFLNENFIGGEVFFNDVEYKPKKGDMLYFSGEESHKINNCIGNRYTLVGFMLNNPLGDDIKNKII